MKTLILFFLFGLLSCPYLLAQDTSIKWQHCFGGYFDDANFGILATPDNGYIVYGDSRDANQQTSLFLVKLAPDSTVLWERTYSEILNSGASLALTPEGGYVIGGGNYPNSNVIILKLKSDGTLEWEREYGGSSVDQASSIAVTKDSGFIVVGYTYSSDSNVSVNRGKADIWVLKLKKDGALEWEKTYGGSGDDEGSSIVSANDVGYVFASFSNSTDGQVNGSDFYYNAWIVHINDTGQILWSNFYDSATSIYPSVIKSLRDSGYIIAGDNESYHSAWLLNLKNDGNVNWQKNYTGQNESYAKDVITTNDSGFMFVGCTGAGAGNNSDNYGDLWVVKLDEKGNKKWQKTYGGSLKDEGCGIAPSFDGEYVISGDTKSDNGDVLNNHGGYDMWVLKINYSVLNGIDESEMADVLISLYPNPTNSKLYFQIKDNAPTNHPPTPFKGGLTQAHATITEINGRILLTQPIITTESTIDVSTLPSGIYLLRYQDADRVWNGKFIKQ